jgi:hypothetical protein
VSYYNWCWWWFGGFASHYYNRGGQGGSSFALTKDSILPEGKIKTYSGSYVLQNEEYYAFLNRKYQFSHVIHERGVWYGNGFAEISYLRPIKWLFSSQYHILYSILYFSHL